MFSRDIVGELRSWSRLPHRKPLVLRGARQVGKTTAVRMFGAEFDQFLQLDLDISADRALFERGLPPGELIQAIRLHLNAPPGPGRTLLFLDEIQSCPRAVHALRYFQESAPSNMYVVAAGSLLETLIARGEVSFPVGRVEYRHMYPLSFAEFLSALDRGDLRDQLGSTPIAESAHLALTRELRKYTFIGGMPEIVAVYAEVGDVAALERLYDALLLSFDDDVEKYARSSAAARVIRHAIRALPFEAGRRIKFEGFGESNYRSREMGEALRTLEQAMLIRLVYPTTRTALPLTPNRRRSPKLQFLDTGLLCHANGLQAALFETSDLDTVYNGLLVEHMVAQELTARRGAALSSSPTFWVREAKQANAEVDFLLQWGTTAIPVEVKSGKSGKLRSLHEFVKRSGARLAVRLYSDEPRVQRVTLSDGRHFTLVSLPHYLASRLPEYLSCVAEQ